MGSDPDLAESLNIANHCREEKKGEGWSVRHQLGTGSTGPVDGARNRNHDRHSCSD